MNDILMFFIRFAATALAALFFGVRFEAPRRTLITSSLLGAIGYAVYLALLDTSEPLAFFLGTFICCLLSEVFARTLKAPTTVVSFVAIIPIVPGIMLYNTMLEFAQSNTSAGVEMAIRTFVAAGCMALAVTVAALLGKHVISPAEHLWESSHKHTDRR